jgi:hypothetical protein
MNKKTWCWKSYTTNCVGWRSCYLLRLFARVYTVDTLPTKNILVIFSEEQNNIRKFKNSLLWNLQFCRKQEPYSNVILGQILPIAPYHNPLPRNEEKCWHLDYANFKSLRVWWTSASTSPWAPSSQVSFAGPETIGRSVISTSAEFSEIRLARPSENSPRP